MTTPRTAVTGKFLPFWGTNHQRISRPQAEEFRAASVAAAAVVPALMAAAADAGDGANSGDKPPAHAVTAPPQSEEGACQQSHTPHGWAPARVAHERTGFVLRDRHTGLFCADCHKSDFTVSLSTACASCHQDVQVRELGTQCQGCHTEASFASKYDAIPHRKAFFPRTGRHGMIPSEECHGTCREGGFQRAALGCAGCHAKDALRASAGNVNHQRAPIAATCEGCHQPTAFLPARYPRHPPCFLPDGSHGAVSCGACHGALRGPGDRHVRGAAGALRRVPRAPRRKDRPSSRGRLGLRTPLGTVRRVPSPTVREPTVKEPMLRETA